MIHTKPHQTTPCAGTTEGLWCAPFQDGERERERGGGGRETLGIVSEYTQGMGRRRDSHGKWQLNRHSILSKLKVKHLQHGCVLHGFLLLKGVDHVSDNLKLTTEIDR